MNEHGYKGSVIDRYVPKLKFRNRVARPNYWIQREQLACRVLATIDFWASDAYLIASITTLVEAQPDL
jgi:hypothetical protein